MLNSFRLYHLRTPNHQGLELPEGFLHFGTCMRSMVLTHNADELCSLAAYDVYEGRQAYSFLLEVICGLRSQLFGETEILGQFREFMKACPENEPRLLKVAVSLISDAKKIRRKYMQNLGSHSYGSLVRRHIEKASKTIHILGAGHLVEEILPWLKKGNFEICIYTRNPENHQGLLENFPEVSLRPLSDFVQNSADVSVVAAPLSGEQLSSWMPHKKSSAVFDLRGTSASDPFSGVSSESSFYPLHDLFADIETNQLKIKQLKIKASQSISVLADEKYLVEVPRPFGWDDLWAM